MGDRDRQDEFMGIVKRIPNQGPHATRCPRAWFLSLGQKEMNDSKTNQRGAKHTTFRVFACLPGALGGFASLYLWLNIIPGNPRGTEILPFIEPSVEFLIQIVTLAVGVPLAFLLGKLSGNKAIRKAGLVCCSLPLVTGFVAFWGIWLS